MGTTSNGILSNGNGNPSFHHVNDYAGHQDVMSNGDSHDFTTRTKWSNGPSSSTTTKQHNDNSQLSSLLPDSISTDVNDTWQATQEIQSQALPSTQTSHREQPTPPPSTREFLIIGIMLIAYLILSCSWPSAEDGKQLLTKLLFIRNSPRRTLGYPHS